MEVSHTNYITIETIEEAALNEYLNNLNTIKSIENIIKRPDCSSIYDYLKK